MVTPFGIRGRVCYGRKLEEARPGLSWVLAGRKVRVSAITCDFAKRWSRGGNRGICGSFGGCVIVSSVREVTRYTLA